MIEALWGIEFVSNRPDGGYGVLVLETGRVLGGDSSFVFVGNYEVNNGVIRAEAKCTNDRGTLESIFGNIKEFTVVLEGPVDQKEMILNGYMKENPENKLAVKLTRRAELP